MNLRAVLFLSLAPSCVVVVARSLLPTAIDKLRFVLYLDVNSIAHNAYMMPAEVDSKIKMSCDKLRSHSEDEIQPAKS